VADPSRIIADIARVGARHAAVGVECNFTENLTRRLALGMSLREAADEILRYASCLGSAARSMAWLGGRIKAAANRLEKNGG
jgi:hypothetical protein